MAVTSALAAVTGAGAAILRRGEFRDCVERDGDLAGKVGLEYDHLAITAQDGAGKAVSIFENNLIGKGGKSDQQQDTQGKQTFLHRSSFLFLFHHDAGGGSGGLTDKWGHTKITYEAAKSANKMCRRRASVGGRVGSKRELLGLLAEAGDEVAIQGNGREGGERE
jgi:hypothetical protein